MAYLDSTRAQAAVRIAWRPMLARLFPAHPAPAGRPALQRALRARVHEVQQMLMAALLAAATIVAVAAALLFHS